MLILWLSIYGVNTVVMNVMNGVNTVVILCYGVNTVVMNVRC